ncbi:MAG: hypothetical protein Fur007_23050 [Rhodoferax sp.]
MAGAFAKSKRGGKLPWGDIPALPFMPVTGINSLPDSAQSLVLQTIADYLSDIG